MGRNNINEASNVTPDDRDDEQESGNCILDAEELNQRLSELKRHQPSEEDASKVANGDQDIIREHKLKENRPDCESSVCDLEVLEKNSLRNEARKLNCGDVEKRIDDGRSGSGVRFDLDHAVYLLAERPELKDLMLEKESEKLKNDETANVLNKEPDRLGGVANGDYIGFPVRVERYGERKQVEGMNKMLKKQMEPGHSENSIDLEVFAAVGQVECDKNELTLGEKDCAEKSKKEEEDGKMKNKQKEIDLLDYKTKVQKLIDQAAELEIDISSLQLDLVYLMSETRNTDAMFEQWRSKIQELKWNSCEKELEIVDLVNNKAIVLHEPTDHEMIDKIDSLITSVSDQLMKNTQGTEIKEKEETSQMQKGMIVQSDIKLEAVKKIHNQAADLEIDICSLQIDLMQWMSEMKIADARLGSLTSEFEELGLDISELQVDLQHLMPEMEKAGAKFQKLSSELEELKRWNIDKELVAVRLVRNKIVILEPIDSRDMDTIDSLLKGLSVKLVKELGCTKPETYHLSKRYEDLINGTGEVKIMNDVANDSSDAGKGLNPINLGLVVLAGAAAVACALFHRGSAKD